jgi:hypothetical protein
MISPNDASISSSSSAQRDQKRSANDNHNMSPNNNAIDDDDDILFQHCTKRKRLSYVDNKCIEDKVSAANSSNDSSSSITDIASNLIPKVNTTATTRTEYFDNLRKSFTKIGKGRDHWWRIGHYSRFEPSSCASADVIATTADTTPDAASTTNKLYERQQQRRRIIIIGIQPHKNPICNGLSIVFYDTTNDGIKLGRILLKNETVHRCSSRLLKNNMGTISTTNNNEFNTRLIQHSALIGMEVNKANRGEGLSKVFIALWLYICTVTNTYPRASIMNKPLISRVLMNSFNFIPQAGGRRVGLLRLTQTSNNTTTSRIGDSDVGGGREDDEESNNNNPQYGLYSLSTKPLQEIFTQRYLRAQNIAILDHAPPSSSSNSQQQDEATTIVYVKTGFEHPIAILEDAVDYTPPQSLVKSNIEMEKYCWQNSCTKFGQQQKDACLQFSNEQRNILISQIDSILQIQTNAKQIMNNDDDGGGTIEFFANLMSLKYAFVPSNEPLCRSTNSDGGSIDNTPLENREEKSDQSIVDRKDRMQ